MYDHQILGEQHKYKKFIDERKRKFKFIDKSRRKCNVTSSNKNSANSLEQSIIMHITNLKEQYKG